jgi:hypothetical protein
MARELPYGTPDSYDMHGTTVGNVRYEPNEYIQATIAIQMEILFLLQRIDKTLLAATEDS